MSSSLAIIFFKLDDQTFAMSVSQVGRVVRAAQIKALPSAPPIILGLLNVGGKVIPVISARKRFNIPEKPIEITDRFLIAMDGDKRIALVCDEVTPAVNMDLEHITQCDEIIPGIGFVKSVVNVDGAMIYLLSVDLILTPEERTDLDRAMDIIEDT